MSQCCKDHENLCVYDQHTLHVDVDVAPDYSQQKKTRRHIAQDRAAGSGWHVAQGRRHELLEHARGGAKYAVRRFPARRELGRELGRELARARARRRELCPHATMRSVAFYFRRLCASARGTRTLPARNNAKRRGFWKYYGNILEISWIYHNLRRELGRTLPARNNPKRCGYDLSGIFQK